MGNWCCIPCFQKETGEYKGLLNKKKSRSTLDNDIFSKDDDLLNDPDIGPILQDDGDDDNQLTDEDLEEYIKKLNPV